jgi:hypothetical protein
VITLGVVVCHLHRLQLLQARLLGYLVLAIVGIVFEVSYIGYVTHITHLVAYSFKVAKQKVEGNGRACVTKMWVAIYGRTTDIHTHTALVQGLKHLLATRECIV